MPPVKHSWNARWIVSRIRSNSTFQIFRKDKKKFLPTSLCLLKLDSTFTEHHATHWWWEKDSIDRERHSPWNQRAQNPVSGLRYVVRLVLLLQKRAEEHDKGMAAEIPRGDEIFWGPGLAGWRACALWGLRTAGVYAICLSLDSQRPNTGDLYSSLFPMEF